MNLYIPIDKSKLHFEGTGDKIFSYKPVCLFLGIDLWYFYLFNLIYIKCRLN